MLQHSENINEIAAALSKAQAAIKGAKRESDNPYFKSRYADLASVWESVRKPLTDAGLSVVQSVSTQESGRVCVTTMLVHTSGQWFRDTASGTPKDDGPQALGSLVTYLRRYSLAAVAGVAPEDDDGEAAEGRSKSPAKAVPVEPKGFSAWWATITALSSLPELEAAWSAAKVEHKRYAVEARADEWQLLKEKVGRS